MLSTASFFNPRFYGQPLMKKATKERIYAESNFAKSICSSVAIFDQQELGNFKPSFEHFTAVSKIIDDANEYLKSLGQVAEEYNLTAENLLIDLKSVLLKVLRQIIGKEVISLPKDLVVYRTHRRKTYLRKNWKKLILGEFSYHSVALEELFLALLFYFTGDLKREDLYEYERWHGYSMGGNVTQGPVQRLVDSFQKEWLRLQQIGY